MKCYSPSKVGSRGSQSHNILISERSNYLPPCFAPIIMSQTAMSFRDLHTLRLHAAGLFAGSNRRPENVITSHWIDCQSLEYSSLPLLWTSSLGVRRGFRLLREIEVWFMFRWVRIDARSWREVLFEFRMIVIHQNCYNFNVMWVSCEVRGPGS